MIVIVPSRGRPERAAAMAASVHETTRAPTQVIVAVDPDDPELDGYRELVPDLFVLDQRLGYCGTLNLIARGSWDIHPILGAFGDDVVFRTENWDDAISRELRHPGIVYPNDLAHGQAHPTAVFMSSQIAKALGWLALPVCHHQYVDDGWKAIGQALGVLRYAPHVVCEHLHPAYGKGEWDATYREVYGPQATLDYEAFHAWEADGMAADVERARAVL